MDEFGGKKKCPASVSCVIVCAYYCDWAFVG